MSYSRLLPAVLTVAVLIAGSARAEAAGQARRGAAVGRAAPAVRGTAIARPGVVGGARVVPFRSYYYPFFRPGFGFYAGYPYGYYPYAYGYGYGYGYPYPYGYSDPYDYPAPPAGYVAAAQGGAYGSVRIEGAPRDAQVFADGYYVGIVSDFDGPVRHLDLPTGAHRIEVRPSGAPPASVDVKVEPGQTITYHANIR